MSVFDQTGQTILGDQHNIGGDLTLVNDTLFIASTVDEPFVSFPKLYRLKGPVIVTEKLDGTNAQIWIGDNGEFKVGSRTRWITPQKDNFGFARWAYDNQEALIATLGAGKHYGEWWGSGIQRGYGQKVKIFSLFNTSRWDKQYLLDSGIKHIDVVPILHTGAFDIAEFDRVLANLKVSGSIAAPGFMNPEGIVIYDTQSGVGFKRTYDYDETGKGKERDEHGNVV